MNIIIDIERRDGKHVSNMTATLIACFYKCFMPYGLSVGVILADYSIGVSPENFYVSWQYAMVVLGVQIYSIMIRHLFYKV